LLRSGAAAYTAVREKGSARSFPATVGGHPLQRVFEKEGMDRLTAEGGL